MKAVIAGIFGFGLLVAAPPREPEPPTPAELTATVQRYCATCHSERLRTGNLSLAGFDVADPAARADAAERVVHKLRTGMMPPPGSPRPGGDTLLALAESLEGTLDAAAAAAPRPGSRTFQRLNRAEYEASVAALLDLELPVGDLLPLDTRSGGFDNIADAQPLSPTLLDAYLRAASEVARLAVGDPDATPDETQYRVVRWASQLDRAEGAPEGTRGGTSVVHVFPADGDYRFRVSLEHETTGELVGNGRSALHTIDGPEQLEIAVDGARVALLEVDRWTHVADPVDFALESEPVLVTAGPHQVTAAFVRRYEGPVQDLISPHEWSIASTATADVYGIQAVPHLKDLVIAGPARALGVSDTPSRRRIFTCRPSEPRREPACAREILERTAAESFRRPLRDDEVDALLGFWAEGRARGGFEAGVRTALEAVLASPHFVFRLEEIPRSARPGRSYRIGDRELATRLAFFLWGGPPDAELLDLARRGRLGDDGRLRAQVDRMLADPRADALATRFAAQWLRLQDLDQIHPDVRFHPDFHEQLKDAMRRETELFFAHLVRGDRPLLELLTADYTYVNERLARHYGIAGVAGEDFVRVSYPDARRRGILGHASVLTLTSLPGRTSPVLRGKWVMEVLLGTPPPPPPPGIPDLEQSGAEPDRPLTTRERMEAHRASPVCATCHRFMDPIGLALDQFDGTGRWRIRENGQPLDTRGFLWDGTPVASAAELQAALLARPLPLVRSFTANLMTYALGRRVEPTDMPAVRAIVSGAESGGWRMSELVAGVVLSEAFRMQEGDVEVRP